jgi:hypothetical protein
MARTNKLTCAQSSRIPAKLHVPSSAISGVSSESWRAMSNHTNPGFAGPKVFARVSATRGPSQISLLSQLGGAFSGAAVFCPLTLLAGSSLMMHAFIQQGQKRGESINLEGTSQVGAPASRGGLRSKIGCLLVASIGMMIAFGIFAAIVTGIMAHR